jgi:hypothetical protein
MSKSLQKAEISSESTGKCKENFPEKQNKNKTITIQFEEEKNSCNQSFTHQSQVFNVEIVVFVAKKLKEFLKKKGWFALPKLTKKGGNLITTTESRCSMRDLVEDFRFYLRAENCELMPPFYYTTQASLFQIVSTLGFRVVKPRNRLILKYHCF